MSRILVTGGAGFIGSHIVERLLKEGHYVRVLDNFSSGKMDNLFFTRGLPATRYELMRGNICDAKTCIKAAKGIDFIMHQAALRSVPKSLACPSDYNEVNIQGVLNMLQAAVTNKVKSFVFASSSSIYGEAVSFPQKETDSSRLISPYALTKLTGEYYCRIFSYHYNLPTVSLRYFNVFGPRQALDDEYAVVIPKFISCMLNNEPPPIYGTGKQSRDFTFVDNVVAANILAMKKFKLRGEVFNVAGGRNYKILEIVNILNKLTCNNIKPRFLKLRVGDVFKTLADLSKSRKLLGFRPAVNFRDGLEITLRYFQDIL